MRRTSRLDRSGVQPIERSLDIAGGQPHHTLRGRNGALADGCSAQFGLPVVQTTFERWTWLKAHLERATQP